MDDIAKLYDGNFQLTPTYYLSTDKGKQYRLNIDVTDNTLINEGRLRTESMANNMAALLYGPLLNDENKYDAVAIKIISKSTTTYLFDKKELSNLNMIHQKLSTELTAIIKNIKTDNLTALKSEIYIDSDDKMKNFNNYINKFKNLISQYQLDPMIGFYPVSGNGKKGYFVNSILVDKDGFKKLFNVSFIYVGNELKFDEFPL